MPGPDYIPTSDMHFANWYQTFSDVCAQNATQLNLTSEDVEAISQAALTLYQSIVAVNEAKRKLASLVSEKDNVRQSAAELARGYAKTFKATKSINDAMLQNLGVVKSAQYGPVQKVEKLTVTTKETGENTLKWDRNMNSGNTIFLIEFSYADQPDWQFAGAVTKTTFIHARQKPGRMVFYRVTATRSGNSSVPCVPVAAYPNTDYPELEIAA